MWETRIRSLGREDPLEKEMAIHSSTIAWKSHGQRSLVGYSSWGHKESNMTERLHFFCLEKHGRLSFNFKQLYESRPKGKLKAKVEFMYRVQ